MRIFISVILVFLVSNLWGQSVKDELIKVNKAYSDIENISFNIKYLYFEKSGDVTPAETMAGVYKRQGKNYYSRVETREVVVNDRYRVVVDNETKHLIIENRHDVFSTQVEDLLANLDSALKMCSDITQKNSQDSKTYNLVFAKGVSDYSQISITVNSKTNLISRLSLFLVDPSGASSPRVDVELTGYSTSLIDVGFFSEKKFVNIDATGTVTLAPKYKSFILLNQKVSIQ